MSNPDCKDLQGEWEELGGQGTIIYLPGDGFYLALSTGRVDASHYAPGMATFTYLGASYAYARAGMHEQFAEWLADYK